MLLQLAPLTVKGQGFQLSEEQAPAFAREIRYPVRLRGSLHPVASSPSPTKLLSDVSQDARTIDRLII